MITDHRRSGHKLMNQINVVPYIDVMLVLLVIFILSAPLLVHSMRVELPRATSAPAPLRTKHITLSIDASGKLYWDGESIDATLLPQRLAAAAAGQLQPELHLHADRSTRYQVIAEVMAAASRAGVTRIGFVSRPEATH